MNLSNFEKNRDKKFDEAKKVFNPPVKVLIKHTVDGMANKESKENYEVKEVA